MSDQSKLEIEITAGLARIIFQPVVSTGPSEDTNPGIGFDLIANSAFEREGKWYTACGVISRRDAARLRDMLNVFLEEHPVGKGAVP